MSSLTTLFRRLPMARSCGLAFSGENCAAVVVARTPFETFVESRFEHADPDPSVAAGRVLERVRDRYGELPPLAGGLPAGGAYFELKSMDAEQVPAESVPQEELVSLLPASLAGLPVRVEAFADALAGESMLAIWAARAETIQRVLGPLGPARLHVERLVPQPLALAGLLADDQRDDTTKLAVNVLAHPEVVLTLVSCGRTLVAWHQVIPDSGGSSGLLIEAALRFGERRARRAVGPGRLVNATVHLSPGVPDSEELAPRLSAAVGVEVQVRHGDWLSAATLATGQAHVALDGASRRGSLMPPIAAGARDRKPFRSMVRWSEAATLAGLAVVAVLLVQAQAAEVGGRLRILEGRMPAWAARCSGGELTTQEKQLNTKLTQVEEFLGRDDQRWTRALELMAGALLEEARLERVELAPEALPGAAKAVVGGRLVLDLEVDAADEMRTASALRGSQSFHQRFPAVQVTRLKLPEDARKGSTRVSTFEIRAREAGPAPAAPAPRAPAKPL